MFNATTKFGWQAILAVMMSVLTLQSAYSQGFDHGDWDRLLTEHVVAIGDGNATAADYAGFAKERAALGDYLNALASVDKSTFDGWAKNDQLAFLINVYNAWTVELILTEYPDLDSIRDLGSIFSSPWKKEIVNLFGDKVSLDHVEHTLIRGSGRYNEPRIHFAVNCASVGCPALAEEAFVGSKIDQQLDDATQRFLRDRSRNRLNGNKLEVSSIFKWYRGDFEKGWQGADSLGQFLARYADALDLDSATTDRLNAGKVSIRFLSYDWSLNDI
ncbi:MAG: DUF547 domain-containing protein [Pseudomonadota bacterium]